MNPKISHSFILIALIAICISCDSNRVYERNIDIHKGIWDTDSVLTFNVDVTDTISPHNILVNVRHTSYYQYQNLFLFINTTAPSGASIRDTFECILADEKGKWYGSGLGDIWDNQILIKRNVRFPFSGEYKFEIEQAMRKKQLPFVMDVGIRVETANNN